MFPPLDPGGWSNLRLPHERGGVSRPARIVFDMLQSSPRAWGCFFGRFAQLRHAGRLPHERGGVSTTPRNLTGCFLSSPRAWGCFCFGFWLANQKTVFPTSVGVFLKSRALFACDMGLPHERGGVSVLHSPPIVNVLSSPRAWGCFSHHIRFCSYARVFPTSVGVFLSRRKGPSIRDGLPHERGGVSTSAATA